MDWRINRADGNAQKGQKTKMQDLFGRELNYVRISVTDRCNYRCRYCMPKSGVKRIPHEDVLTYEEIFFLMEILQELGVKKIRFTGGEPLVRKGMLPFLEKACAFFPQLSICLTTNGSTLSQYALPLAQMRLSSINISLDTLNDSKFSYMTRGAPLSTVLNGINELCSEVRFEMGTQIKINTVLLRGFNDDAAEDLIEYAKSQGATLRFIEFMPLDKTVWSEESFVPFAEVLKKLPETECWQKEEQGTERASSGPARYYVHSFSGQRIGVISAVSQHFCASCNRLRITSTGEVRACLFNNAQVSLLGALRAHDTEKVREGLLVAAALKPEIGMNLCRDQGHMYKIGG